MVDTAAASPGFPEDCAILVPHDDVDRHGIMGTRVGPINIYTRTIVLWAVGIHIDIDQLWQHLQVIDEHGQQVSTEISHPVVDAPTVHFRPTTRPVVRMVKNSQFMRGSVPKRSRSRPFKSVLSVDVQYGSRMPNLKISKQHTIQITGCCSMHLLGAILNHLTEEYSQRGFFVSDPQCAGFVCDIVLSNVFFRMPSARLGRHRRGRLDRAAVCEAFNTSERCPPAIATFEPLLNDASVSIKLFDRKRPNAGFVYPWWSRSPVTQAQGWRLLNNSGFQSLVNQQHARPCVQGDRPICHTFRIFGSGSVVQVGRWPETMAVQREYVESVILSVSKNGSTSGPAHHRPMNVVVLSRGLKQQTLLGWLTPAS